MLISRSVFSPATCSPSLTVGWRTGVSGDEQVPGEKTERDMSIGPFTPQKVNNVAKRTPLLTVSANGLHKTVAEQPNLRGEDFRVT
jgi:hypothetical protein